MGFSERVFWIFGGVSAREGVPFPQTTRSRYGHQRDIPTVFADKPNMSSSRSNILSINSELASEENRVAKRMIVIPKKEWRLVA